MGIRESLLNTITSVADSDFVRIVTSAGASSKATVRNLFKGFESNLSAKSSLTTSDYIRVVGSDNEAYKQLVSDVAKKIIENYTGSSLAGSSQSVKNALDSLNSNTEYIHSTGISLAGQLTIRDAIVSAYNSATANPTQLQLAFAQVSGVGRFVILIHKNSANYGSALAFGYGYIGKLYSITCSGGTLGTLKQVSFTDV